MKKVGVIVWRRVTYYMYEKSRGNCVEEGKNIICMKKNGITVWRRVKSHMYLKQ